MAPSKLSAVLLVAGGLALAGDAFVNPTAPRTAPRSLQYVSNIAGVSAVEGTAAPQEQQSSWTGLCVGVALGMLVGLTGVADKASAMNYALPKEGEKPNDRVYAKDIARESRRGPSEGGSGSATGAGTMAPQDFDKNVDKALEKRLAKFDVEEEFNSKKVLEQFQVDKSQIPKFEFAPVNSTDGSYLKNDPSLKSLNAPGAKVETKAVSESSTAAPAAEKKVEEAKGGKKGFSFFKK
jgi:hypothetical protein